MLPSSRSQSAATTALTAGIGELFRVKRLREIPHWWILGRCGPPTYVVLLYNAIEERSLVAATPAVPLDAGGEKRKVSRTEGGVLQS